MSISAVLGGVTLCLAVISYGVYFRDVFAGRTIPHGVTWLIWTALNIFIFMQQNEHGAGAGAWITVATAVANFLVFLLSFRYGERSLRPIDYVCLALAAGTFTAWLQGADAVLSVILASCVFVLGFIPTFFKSYKKPRQETSLSFALNSLKFLIAVFALESMNVVTVFYPATLFAMNALFVAFLFYRRARVV